MAAAIYSLFVGGGSRCVHVRRRMTPSHYSVKTPEGRLGRGKSLRAVRLWKEHLRKHMNGAS